MIDDIGYPKLIDFGTAKRLMENKGHNRTFTMIGTPHYMAPEIHEGKGYSESVDLWALGICIYEFVCGAVPFGADEEDPYEIYKAVATEDL